MIDIDVLKERALKEPEIRAEYDLAVLLGAITPENVHEEVDFGAAVGQELGLAGRYSPRLRAARPA
jgi:antitoxin MazE